MIRLKKSRGEARFDHLDSGENPYSSDIIGAIAGGIASAAASAVGSELLGGLFGGEEEVDDAYQEILAQQQALASGLIERGDDALIRVQQIYNDLDPATKQAYARVEPYGAQAAALASGVQDVPQWVSATGRALAETGQGLSGWGAEDRARHQALYQPLEQEAIDDYRQYMAGGFARERGQAAADVNAAYDAQRDNALRTLEGYGIDPGQARWTGLDQDIQRDRAAQQAMAMTNAQRYAEERGRQMRGDILDYGSMYPKQAGEYSQLGTQATGLGGQLGRYSTQAAGDVADIYKTGAGITQQNLGMLQDTARIGGQLYGSPVDYFTAAGGALRGAGATTAAYMDDRWRAGGRYDPLGEQIGEVVGTGVESYFKGRDATSRPSGARVPGPYPGQTQGPGGAALADGGPVVGPGGPKDDAVPIRASDGEYVVPAEVVMRKGTEFFDKLIEKTRGEMQALPV